LDLFPFEFSGLQHDSLVPFDKTRLVKAPVTPDGAKAAPFLVSAAHTSMFWEYLPAMRAQPGIPALQEIGFFGDSHRLDSSEMS
jgi:hypothetical protein